MGFKMFKIAIIDDEYIIRNGIAKT